MKAKTALFPNIPKRDQIALVALAFVFMMGQIISPLLKLYGWPSDWF